MRAAVTGRSRRDDRAAVLSGVRDARTLTVTAERG
jgi:hypothetical protein